MCIIFDIRLWMTSERYAVGDSWIIIGHETGCLNPINRLISIYNRPTQFFFQTKKNKGLFIGLSLQCISWSRFTFTITHVFSTFSPCSLWWETKDGEHECICKSIVSFTFMGEIKVEVSLTAVVQDSMKRISSNRRAAKRLQKRFFKWS